MAACCRARSPRCWDHLPRFDRAAFLRLIVGNSGRKPQCNTRVVQQIADDGLFLYQGDLTLRQLHDLAAGCGAKAVISGVSLAIAPGQSLALLGHNGGGKTTSLQAVMGLRPARCPKAVDFSPTSTSQTRSTSWPPRTSSTGCRMGRGSRLSGMTSDRTAPRSIQKKGRPAGSPFHFQIALPISQRGGDAPPRGPPAPHQAAPSKPAPERR